MNSKVENVSLSAETENNPLFVFQKPKKKSKEGKEGKEKKEKKKKKKRSKEDETTETGGKFRAKNSGYTEVHLGPEFVCLFSHNNPQQQGLQNLGVFPLGR